MSIHEYPTTEDVMRWASLGLSGGLRDDMADPREWLADHDRKLSRRVWFEGASSRQCHCNAYDEGECACGMYPSDVNPYISEASTPQYTSKEKP